MRIIRWLIGTGLLFSGTAGAAVQVRQITFDNQEHLLGVYNVWSPDDQWIVYTCGPNNLNDVVNRVEVQTGKTETLYRIKNQASYGPGCGTASYCNNAGKIVFIHGPRNASADRKYEFWRRSACMIDDAKPEMPVFLDARDVTAPFTEGALRGGTHCHQFSRDGEWITYTYNDMLVSPDLRTIGVSKHWKSVTVDAHKENHDGAWFSALLVPVVENPRPGSDELSRAYENCWVEFPNGRRAVSFKGDHVSADGSLLTDIYLVDVPEALAAQDLDQPLAGTTEHLPFPSAGATVHKLTDFSRPGSPKLTRNPRFWLSSAPDGSAVFFLGRDANGINQVFSVSTTDGQLRQITTHDSDVISTVRVNPSGEQIAYICDSSVFTVRLSDLHTERLTQKGAYKPQKVMWSNSGVELVFQSRVEDQPAQLFVINLNPHAAVLPVSRFEKNGWGDRHEEILRDIKEKDPEIIFVGDSITDRWAHAGKAVWDRYYKPLGAVNMGIGGDSTQHVLWRLQNGELEGINPKLAVVMIGTNNSNGDAFTAEQIADGIIAVVSELRVRLPETKILLLSIFPRGTYAQRKELPKPAEYSSQRAKNERASEIASRMADGETVFYLDITDKLVDSKNRVSPDIFPDLVHPNEKGYAIWAKAMSPLLQKFLGE